ncbi:methyltransferase [Brevundimonas sp. LM2]|uniref:class I SAM-dependent methyltransferase n=1 Tax=Brevundimonas sp. LM2 TaxID=1938605 RepID=UPI000983EEBC|nr:class I SAM-dependent methyltransferase [Brevundimonas sp. LM2]AQR60709.1 methyltransferase [Brevundimonas sp. LM2]
MRRFALTLAMLAVTAGSAVAQTLPSLAETPAQRVARRDAMTPPVLQEDEQLQAAIGSDARPAADVARDVYRHPYETLTFWGLMPGLNIVEIEPGRAGWWSAILRPYAAATGGTYTAVGRPLEGMGVAEGSADLIVVARAFHNWQRAGRTAPYLEAFFKTLKPGGILAVEQHRAEEGLNAEVTAPTGYVSESYVIKAAQAAGFVLEARSELNANPRDDRDHPYGVWSLPPNRVSAPRDGVTTDRPTPLTEAERAALDAVGESDRMTLRFRKPA